MTLHSFAPLFLLLVMATPSGCTSSTSPSLVVRCGDGDRGFCLLPEEIEASCGREAMARCPAGFQRVCARDGLTDEELWSLPACRDRIRPCPACDPCPACPGPVAPGAASRSVPPGPEDANR